MIAGIILCVIYIFSLGMSFMFYKRIKRVRKKFIAVWIVGYLVLTYLYFEIINQIHHYLRDRNIFIEFGHADIDFLIVFLLSLITALLSIIFGMYKRKK
jgi:hypothetical protein